MPSLVFAPEAAQISWPPALPAPLQKLLTTRQFGRDEEMAHFFPLPDQQAFFTPTLLISPINELLLLYKILKNENFLSIILVLIRIYVWLHMNHSSLTRDQLISLLPKRLEEGGSDNVLWGCPDNQASSILLLTINKVHCPCLVQDVSSLNICFRQQEGGRVGRPHIGSI